MQPFKPIGKTSISQEIVNQIMEMLSDGTLKCGDKMPPERQLCEMLSVGRGSVREAIKILETLGIVERKNKTVVLCDASPANALALMAMNETVADINDILETRMLIEKEIVKLAVARATPEEIEGIKSTVVETNDVKTLMRCDQEFHKALAQSTHNKVLIQVYDVICEMLFQTHRLYDALLDAPAEQREGFFSDWIAQHYEIIAALEERNISRAKNAMLRHLNATEDRLIRTAGASLKQG